MKLLGILQSVIGLVPTVISWFRGKDGQPAKPSTLDIFTQLVSNIMPRINQAIAYGELSTQAQVDSWLTMLDSTTGTDAGAMDIFRNVPPDKEEEMFDHLKEMLKLYLYAHIEVPGYFVPPTT